jgi:diguanylate cyclase (GGDEF)-like protein
MAAKAHQKNRGLGHKISRLVAYSVFIAMVFLAAFLMFNQLRTALAEQKESLQSLGYVYASALAEHIETKNQVEIQRVLRSISRMPEIIYGTAVDQNNKPIAAMGNAAYLESNLATGQVSNWTLLTKGVLPVAVDIIKSGNSVGRLILIADISDLRGNLIWTLMTTLAASVLAAALATPFSLPLQRRITTPIVTLTKLMQKVRETRTYQTTEVKGAEGETKVLVETFNSMISDINQRDLALQKLAYFDPLTGLPNRVNFQKHLEKICGQASEHHQAAVFLLDIDNFHAINDAMGHSIGDALLMNVAALLNDEVNEQSHIARIGGDEFAITVSGIRSREEAELCLAKFIASLYRPITILGNELHVTASVGALLIPHHAGNAGDAQRNLDLALHGAKQTGVGNVYFYKQELTDNIKEEAELVKGLRAALSGEGLEVHYQAIVNLISGTVDGFEALARWNHPTRGMISPAKFIPIAEKAGLISALGDWVLLTACKEAKSWIDAGLPPRSVAVNISTAQMLQADFMERVQKTLAASQLPPHLLYLELTESLFVGKSMNTVQRILSELKALGIRTALDDFGTGYSSLSYLEHLPFDKLKIDRAFVMGLSKSQKSVDLLHGIVALAHALGMLVVAEGAESEIEVEILKRLGADSVQGYVFAKPSKAETAIARAAEIDKTQKAA